jgi:hypothetical protein
MACLYDVNRHQTGEPLSEHTDRATPKLGRTGFT